MHIRPFFWFLLAFTCVSVLVFAAVARPHVSALLNVHINQEDLLATRMTSFDLHISDAQGLPIEEAEVLPSAHMTNMDMHTPVSTVTKLGNGRYNVQLWLNMAGPWAITIRANADGFTSLQRTFYVQVN